MRGLPPPRGALWRRFRADARWLTSPVQSGGDFVFSFCPNHLREFFISVLYTLALGELFVVYKKDTPLEACAFGGSAGRSIAGGVSSRREESFAVEAPGCVHSLIDPRGGCVTRKARLSCGASWDTGQHLGVRGICDVLYSR